MPADLSRPRLRLWLRLLATTNEMERALRSRLRAEFGTTLPRFDVMAALDRAPDGLSMSELSRRLMVTNGNTTMLVGALANDGLVQRSVSTVDRRSFTVELTDAGRQAFAGMARAHARWVSELLAGVDGADADELSQVLHDARLAIQANASRRPTTRGVT
jgi:DNA-binding MarR family transcriptional regulator